VCGDIGVIISTASHFSQENQTVVFLIGPIIHPPLKQFAVEPRGSHQLTCNRAAGIGNVNLDPFNR
jgi:hypothetical protein